MPGRPPSDPWRIPTFLMWLVFMGIGFVPDAVFHFLQQAAGVVRYEAMIGSPLVLTVAFAGYLAAFAYQEAVHGGCSRALAFAHAVQIGSVALVAFVPVTFEAVQFAMAARYSNLALLSAVILGTAGIKLAAWGYLLSFLVRYYLLGRAQVFARMVSMFPSAHVLTEPPALAGLEQSTISDAESFENHGNAGRVSE